MKKQNNKFAFTLVELLVVIAILAVLATVAIVGYSSFTKKAQQSVDEQAVTQMNTVLAALSVTDQPASISEFYLEMNKANLEAKNYKPLYQDRLFFWDKDLHQVLYTEMDANYTVIYPAKYLGETKATLNHEWYSLSGVINKTAVSVSGGVAEVSTPEELYYLVGDGNTHGATNITLNNDIDLMGAEIGLEYASNTGDIVLSGGNDGATISNATQSKFKEVGTGLNSGKTYICGFYPEVLSGNHVIFENLTFKDSTFGDLGTGMVGLVGKVQLGGSVEFKNVTIDGCTFNGNNKVGAFVGWENSSTVKIDADCVVKNSIINSSKGESGKLVGAVTDASNLTIAQDVVDNMENVKLNIVSYNGSTGKTIEIYRGTVTLVDAKSTHATQTIFDRLTGMVVWEKPSGSKDYRPFNEDALFSCYTNSASALYCNGYRINLLNNTGVETPTYSFGSYANITQANTTLYTFSELPTANIG